MKSVKNFLIVGLVGFLSVFAVSANAEAVLVDITVKVPDGFWDEDNSAPDLLLAASDKGKTVQYSGGKRYPGKIGLGNVALMPCKNVYSCTFTNVSVDLDSDGQMTFLLVDIDRVKKQGEGIFGVFKNGSLGMSFEQIAMMQIQHGETHGNWDDIVFDITYK